VLIFIALAVLHADIMAALSNDEPEFSQYVRKFYSIDGVEVVGWDSSSTTLSLPPDFDDLTDFLSEAVRQFGLEADYRWDSNCKMATLIFTPNGTPVQSGTLVLAKRAIIFVVVFAAMLVLMSRVVDVRWPFLASSA
jgi:hypothetical protein